MRYICKICGQIIDTNDICPFCGSDSSKIEPYEEEEKKTYRCLNCGHELDQNDHCPFCGATSSMIFDISKDTTEDDMVETPKTNKPVFEYCEGDDCCCDDEYCSDEECCSEEHQCCCEQHENDEEQHECCCNQHENDEEQHECCCHNPLTAEGFANAHHCDDCSCEDCDGTCQCNDDSDSEQDQEEGCCHCGHCEDENPYYFDDLVQDLLTVYGHLYKNDYAQAKIFAEYLKNFFLEVALDFEKELDVNEALENLENNVYFKDIIKQFE